jgi:hypothetical protein
VRVSCDQMLCYERNVDVSGAVVHRITNKSSTRTFAALSASLALSFVSSILWWHCTRNLALLVLLACWSSIAIFELLRIVSEETLTKSAGGIVLTTKHVMGGAPARHILAEELPPPLLYEALSTCNVRFCLGFVQAAAGDIVVAFPELRPSLLVLKPIYQELLHDHNVSN